MATTVSATVALQEMSLRLPKTTISASLAPGANRRCHCSSELRYPPPSIRQWLSMSCRQRQRRQCRVALRLRMIVAGLALLVLSRRNSEQSRFHLRSWQKDDPTERRVSSEQRPGQILLQVPTTKIRKTFPYKRFESNEYTIEDFWVAGVNLATYGMNDERRGKATQQPHPFALFDSFDLSAALRGNESWVDLVRLRRDLAHRKLPFYVDKVARKRAWERLGGTAANEHAIRIQSPHAHVLKYAHELQGKTVEEQTQEILQLLQSKVPSTHSFAAKPTHLSCSGGVWLVQRDTSGTTRVSHGKDEGQTNNNFELRDVATSLAENLHVVQEKCGRRVLESWGLQHVQPGIGVEELYTAPSSTRSSSIPFMEFKVFTIWGRVWMAVWRPGKDGIHAFVHRNGTLLQWKGRPAQLPDFLDWSRIVQMAEQLGAHKDMFRTDIFVGAPVNRKSNGSEHAAVEYVVSETEFHPTPLRGTERLFDEAGRLWLAGYAIGNYHVVPDSEVPPDFMALE